ncbi:MAG: hypothetical protein WCA20_27830 [Candidatus Sulfotelmatobacter sp.]
MIVTRQLGPVAEPIEKAIPSKEERGISYYKDAVAANIPGKKRPGITSPAVTIESDCTNRLREILREEVIGHSHTAAMMVASRILSSLWK